MIGTVMPMSRARSTKSKYAWLSKKSWVIRKLAPASSFSFANSRSDSGLLASGCTSGKHAAPMQNG